MTGTAAAAVVALGGTALGTSRRGPLAALLPGSLTSGHPLFAPRAATAAAAALVLCWAALVALAASGRVGVPAVCGLSAAWALPLAVGAPLLSADAYAYLADGHLLATGHDPYRVGADALGAGSRWLAPVDPQWAHARSPYGPAALLLARAAAATGGVGPGVAVLVAVAVVSVAVVGRVVWSLAPLPHRPLALALWLPAPPVLLHLVGGAHLDALMVALTALSLLALHRRRPLLAAGLAGLATAVKAPAAVAVVVVAVVALPAGWAAARAAVARLGVAATAYVVPALAVGDPWRLASTLRAPARATTLAAPATIASRLLGGHGASVLRVIALVLAAAVVVALVATASRRSPAATVGWSLLAVVVGGPVFYPWYLTWPLGCLAAVAGGGGRRWLVPLVAVAGLPALPGLAGLSAAGVVLVVVVAAIVLAAGRQAGRVAARAA